MRLAVAVLVAVTGWLTVPAAVAERPAGRGDATSGHTVPVHDDLLPGRAHGAAAVRQLGETGLRRAAERNDMAAARLRTLLEQDPTAWVTGDGQLYYVESPPTTNAPAAGADPATAAAAAAPPRPLADTFRLHSLAGAQRTIFLDVDGGPVSGTWANRTYGLPASTEPAWDPGNNGAAFSDAELASVQEVWARVAEDYAPFGVDVTTEAPAATALDRAGVTDQDYGVRVLIGPNPDVWSGACGQKCGGIAPVGVFDDYGTGSSAGRYAFVFSQGVSDYPKWVAEAAAHEAGHTLGLGHDGSATDPDYYAGTALWGPIMGAPYNSAVTQWSKGEYAGATNPEDDLGLLGSTSMAPTRGDDAGDTIATAAARPQGPVDVTSAADVDVFDVGTCSGNVTVRADPAATGPNLDISLALLGPDGSVVAQADPPAQAQRPAWPNPPYATGMNASVSTFVTGVRHLYARVRGAAAGGWSTGYGSYGSIGAYQLGISGCVAQPGPPDAPSGLTVAPDALRRTLSARWTEPAGNGGAPITGYQVSLDGGPAQTVSQPSYAFAGVATGTHRVTVRAVNALGAGDPATADVVMPQPPTVPGGVGDVRTATSPVAHTVTVTWTAPADDGGNALTGYRVHQYGADGTDLGAQSVAADVTRVTLGPVATGQTVRLGVAAVNEVGEGAASRATVTMPAPPPTIRVPGAPAIGRASPGPRGGAITVTVRWSPPRSNGGAAIDRYRVTLYRLDASGRVVRTTAATVGVRTSVALPVARGRRYRFAVRAHNRVGWGALSARSAAVRGR